MLIRSARVHRWAQHTEVDLNRLEAAMAAWGVRAAWAFGSTVRGDDEAGSDSDIAVITAPYGTGGTSPPAAYNVEARLPIEWHCWPDMPASLQAEALATGIALFESAPGEAELIAREAMAAWQCDAPARAARRAAELADARPLI